MPDFEDFVANDTQGVGTVLDDIDTYSTTIIYNAIVNSTDEVLLGYFSEPEARERLTTRLDALATAAGPALDSDVLKQYCMVLITLINDIDAANQDNGAPVEEGQLSQQQEQQMEAAEANFREYLHANQDVYNTIVVEQEGAEWGLADYLVGQLNQGGCNNVQANWMRTVVEPYAEYGYVRLDELIRNHLLTQVGIGV